MQCRCVLVHPSTEPPTPNPQPPTPNPQPPTPNPKPPTPNPKSQTPTLQQSNPLRLQWNERVELLLGSRDVWRIMNSIGQRSRDMRPLLHFLWFAVTHVNEDDCLLRVEHFKAAAACMQAQVWLVTHDDAHEGVTQVCDTHVYDTPCRSTALCSSCRP